MPAHPGPRPPPCLLRRRGSSRRGPTHQQRKAPVSWLIIPSPVAIRQRLRPAGRFFVALPAWPRPWARSPSAPAAAPPAFPVSGRCFWALRACGLNGPRCAASPPALQRGSPPLRKDRVSSPRQKGVPPAAGGPPSGPPGLSGPFCGVVAGYPPPLPRKTA